MVIRKAIELTKKNRNSVVSPHHIFLAASLIPKSIFVKSGIKDESLFKEIQEYYLKTGAMKQSLRIGSYLVNDKEAINK